MAKAFTVYDLPIVDFREYRDNDSWYFTEWRDFKSEKDLKAQIVELQAIKQSKLQYSDIGNAVWEFAILINCREYYDKQTTKRVGLGYRK